MSRIENDKVRDEIPQRLQMVIDEINSKEASDGSPKVLARMDVVAALAKGFPEYFDITFVAKRIKLKDSPKPEEGEK